MLNMNKTETLFSNKMLFLQLDTFPLDGKFKYTNKIPIFRGIKNNFLDEIPPNRQQTLYKKP